MISRRVGVAVLIALVLATAAASFWRHVAPSVRPPRQPPPTKPIADRSILNGEWKRVEFPDAVFPDNYRSFTQAGGFRVLYGDVVYIGAYRFLNDTTMETVNRYNGETDTWTIGVTDDDKLVMVHHRHGWVELYVKVPVGTLQPSRILWPDDE